MLAVRALVPAVAPAQGTADGLLRGRLSGGAARGERAPLEVRRASVEIVERHL
jgi:hypothetical protein